MDQPMLFEDQSPRNKNLGFRFSLRDYQEEFVSTAIEFFDQGCSGVLIRSPTGTGKTIQGAACAYRWLKKSDKHRVLIIADQRQLIWQFAEEIQDALGITPGIEMANRVVNEGKVPLVTVASRATLQNRSEEEGTVDSRIIKFSLGYNWLIIWDEAHKHHPKLPSVAHIIEWFKRTDRNRHLGLTATPERGDKKSLKSYLPKIAGDYRLFTFEGRSAVSDGWAVPYKQIYIPVVDVDFDMIGDPNKKRDWNEQELDAALHTAKQIESMVVPTIREVGSRRTIVFSASREMAHDVAAAINVQLGWDAAKSLDGTVPEADRKKVYRQHKEGKFQFLSVCGLCREGYNDPGIAAVAVFRPTKSKTLAEQMKGRGCRPLRGVVDGLNTPEDRRAAIAGSEKPDCMIIDLVGVTGLGDCASTAEIYAEGMDYADEIVKEVNKWVLEAARDGRTIDIAQKVGEARETVEERKRRQREALEKEALRKKRRKELQEQRKAQAARRKQARIRYDKQYIPQGQAGSEKHPKKPKEYDRMPYGKFRGKKIDTLPGWYIEHLMENSKLSASIKREVERVWRKRNGQSEEEVKPPPKYKTEYDRIVAEILSKGS